MDFLHHTALRVISNHGIHTLSMNIQILALEGFNHIFAVIQFVKDFRHIDVYGVLKCSVIW